MKIKKGNINDQDIEEDEIDNELEYQNNSKNIYENQRME